MVNTLPTSPGHRPDTAPGLHVLALNSGSSSLKFGLYRVASSGTDTLLAETAARCNPGEAMSGIKGLLAESRLPPPSAIGHRIVHGGSGLRQHCVLDHSVLQQLQSGAMFAPLHMPKALSLIELAHESFPGLPHVACFDTTFHADLPEVARVLPIARELQLEGVQRYGFHGLACASIVDQLAHDLPQRLVIAHLGNGASVTAVKAGKSIDTSMGLTPAGGVVMGTRSGDLDPGVLIYLIREKKFDAAMLEDLLNHRSGLLGVSGIASDMRQLQVSAASNPAARLAIEMFCYSVCKQVAGMIAVLDGIDCLVFTGGIGENDAKIRAAICGRLSWSGITLDEARNRAARNPLNDCAAPCAVRVLAAQENALIARLTWALVAGTSVDDPRGHVSQTT